ncbi:MAG: hypothetical protein V4570_06855 [Pseudomonadota bacterium]
MAYKIITDTTVEPITLAEAREHLRLVAFGDPLAHPDDAYVSSLISVARQFCEEYTERSFSEKTIELALDGFPDGAIKLPLTPVKTIESVNYVDSDETEQTVASNQYAIDDYSTPNWLIPTNGFEWPATLETANNVKVRMVTSDVSPPHPVLCAMKLIIGEYYKNRELSVNNININELPMGVFSLLQPYRINIGV